MAIWAILKWILLLVLAGLIHLPVYSCGSARKLCFWGVRWLSTEAKEVNRATYVSSASRLAWAWSHGGSLSVPRTPREEAVRPLEA